MVDRATERRLVVTRSAGGLTLHKTISLDGDRLRGGIEVALEVRNQRDTAFAGAVELEWNMNLMGGGSNPAAYYRANGRESRHDAAGKVGAGVELAIGNEYAGVALSASADPPAAARWYPVETVSNSEAGFERVYQGSCLSYRWPVRLAPGRSSTFSLRFEFSSAADLTAAEAS